MSWLAIAGVIWGSIATVGAIAAAFIRWRSTSDETTAALWKEEAEAWKARAIRLDESFSALEKRVDHLESENKMLRALHDNREEMNALRDAITSGFSTLSNLLIAHQVKGE
ncbi:hypothetical protein [Micromonospora coerulea]|uniref:hypothetical protein n=1 Tax=Micromonospora coerulea TaxID=47856 RepID=UPI0019058F4F|nr:hypothetical protein [Micromonospora veneta]